MIKIQGLTARQVAIMDLLWHSDSLESAELIVQSLPTHRDRCDARSLMHMALVDTLELEGALDEHAEAAADCVSLAQLR